MINKLTQENTNLLRSTNYGGSLQTAALDYAAAPARFTAISNYALQALEFEKKVCRAGFRKNFGRYLPSPATLEMHLGLLDVNPSLNSSRWSKTNKSAPLKMAPLSATHDYDSTRAYPTVCFKNSTVLKTRPIGLGRGSHHENMDKRLLHSGIQLMSADWILEGLTQQIQNQRSVRAVIHELIRDAEILLNSLRSTSPVMGVRITASGRLGKQKKGMAQLQSLSIGKVPLGTFSRKVDYSQGFALTKRGLVGLKVWVAFR